MNIHLENTNYQLQRSVLVNCLLVETIGYIYMSSEIQNDPYKSRVWVIL